MKNPVVATNPHVAQGDCVTVLCKYHQRLKEQNVQRSNHRYNSAFNALVSDPAAAVDGLWSPSMTVLTVSDFSRTRPRLNHRDSQRIPDLVTPEDAEIVRTFPGPPSYRVRCCEAMARRSGNHPFFVARLANELWRFEALPIIERMLGEVRGPFTGWCGSASRRLKFTVRSRRVWRCLVSRMTCSMS